MSDQNQSPRQKRSKFIDLTAMRKVSKNFAIKPLTLGVTTAILSACSKPPEALIVKDVDECLTKTSLDQQSCEAAYQQALSEAEKTSPKYRDRYACESEFGYNQCVQSSSGSFFMPFMAGFLINELLFDRDRRYYSGYYNPVYRYNRPYSRYHDMMMLADGTSIGKYGKSSYRINKSATQKKPKITRTVSRGGFGSVASAKSNWGGGSKGFSKGWGG